MRLMRCRQPARCVSACTMPESCTTHIVLAEELLLPIPAAESRRNIAKNFLNRSIPPSKTWAQGWDFGCHAKLCRNTVATLLYAAALLPATAGQCFPFFCRNKMRCNVFLV